MLTIRPLHHSSDHDRSDVSRIFQEAPTYTQLVEGRLPSDEDVEDFFFGKPANKNVEDKVTLGFSVGPNLIGCADLIRGSIEPDCLWIGLLLFSEKHQRLGYGSVALSMIDGLARDWGYKRLQLGAISTNPSALAFWIREEFMEIRRVNNPRFAGDMIVMERSIGSFPLS